jgi:hypothetical protein
MALTYPMKLMLSADTSDLLVRDLYGDPSCGYLLFESNVILRSYLRFLNRGNYIRPKTKFNIALESI